MDLEHEQNLELGKKSAYDSYYDASKLFAIPRANKRLEIGIDPEQLPFYGYDSWNHYEVSWLNAKGKPMAAMAEISYDCHSSHIIESKSLKLYFNTFNNSIFASVADVEATIKSDLGRALQAEVRVCVQQLGTHNPLPIQSHFAGECLDDLDVACSVYTVTPSLLALESTHIVSETLYSDLLKSNCLVTYQPDWGSVQISYTGCKIAREGLLQYLVSFRNHNEFHEQCIERIFIDIMNHCQPQQLTVYGRYTRRGGLDINPFRSSSNRFDREQNKIRLPRQ